MSAFTARSILYTGVLSMVSMACTGIVEAPDEGAGASTGVAVCSSNAYWKDMDTGSELMHPGGKCNDCHNKNPLKAPNYAVAGTVYPTLHEPDECNGVGGAMSEAGVADIAIIITEQKTGRQLPPIPVNKAGNFYLVNVNPPFNVKVKTKDGKENKMTMLADNGDCNKCHTQNGAEGAPGRVTAP